jgi:hypothetical protein
MNRRFLLAILLVPFAAPLARAEDPFVYTETTTSGTPATVLIKGHSIINVTDDLLLGYGSGAKLYGQNVSATLNYAGVPDALKLTVSADHTTATLSYPGSAKPGQTFSAVGSAYPASSLDNQVYNSITDSRNQNWENLQERLNQNSTIMPADGNPSAATGFLAAESFDRFALLRDQDPASSVRVDWPRHQDQVYDFYAPVVTLDIDGSHINSTGFNGYDLRWELAATGKITPHIGYSVALPYQYRDIAGADSETVGIEAGLPIDFLGVGRRPAVAWTVTPYLEFAYSDSRRLGSQLGLFDGGVASRLAFRFGRDRDWAVAFGSQFTGYAGIHDDNGGGGYYDDGYGDGYYGGYGGYDEFRGHISQQLFKQGVQVLHDFDHGVSVDVGVTYSSFVQNAAVDQWWTPRLGVGWQLDKHIGMRWDLNGDLASHYTAVGGRFEFDFRF